jgi:glycosyltransferase involved in cell wall biosynthesis/cellulose synthase/poly-beta-1,6-N-acetylglucosamine synthase-like glycosyltransferase/O-antigen/teichoic acid export membrane protein
MSSSQLDVIIPVKNEQSSLRQLVLRIHASLSQAGISYRLIFVNDYSTDRTQEILQQLSKKYPLLIHNKIGAPGKAFAILEGAKLATTPYLAIIDGDLQYPPEALPQLYHLARKTGMAVANRRTHQTSRLRRWGSRLNYYLFGRLLWNLDCDIQSGLKVFRTDIIRYLSPDDVTPWTLDLPLLQVARDLGYRISSHDILFSPRKSGQSKVRFFNTSLEIAFRSLKLRLQSARAYPFQLPASFSPGSSRGRGLIYRTRRYLTHTNLPASRCALVTFTPLQKAALILIFLLILANLVIHPQVTVTALIALLSFIYFTDAVFSLFLLIKSLRSPQAYDFSPDELARLRPEDLPVYTILCPLYRESDILPDFLRAIDQLDWPKDRLDVLLLLEQDDHLTQAAVNHLPLPAYVRPLIVPPSLPKTKPKACNYGLSFARGEYVVIYDAEDRPDPSQLKKAYLAFQKAGPRVFCLQSQLNYYNPNHNLLTKLFTAEYSTWFDLILPGLQSLKTIIPLGGTSNHFRTQDLIRLHGWDPFNVTEDCDLGIRLFTAGYRTAIINSTTYEEANSRVTNWLRQRSRWIKGYLQTYFVHLRHPLKFFRRHGLHALLFQLIIGLRIGFSLINPLLWAVTLSYFLFFSRVGPAIQSVYPNPILYPAVFSLIFGNFIALYQYMIGLARRRQWSLIKFVFLVPVYWLLSSLASVLAIYQLITNPHYWEKTQHGLHLGTAPAVRLPGISLPRPRLLPLPVYQFFSRLNSSVSVKLSLTLPQVNFTFPPFSQLRRSLRSGFSNKLSQVIPISTVNQPQASPAISLASPNQSPPPVSSSLPGIEEQPNESPLRRKTFSSIRLPAFPLPEFLQPYTSGGLLIIALVFSNLAQLLFQAYLGRKLSLEEFGILSTFTSLLSLSGIFSASISRTLSHQSAKLLGRYQTLIAAHWRTTRRRIYFISLGVALAWSALTPVISLFFRTPYPLTFLFFTPIWVMGFLASVDRGFLEGNHRFSFLALSLTVEAVTKLTLTFTFVRLGLAPYIYAVFPLSLFFSFLTTWSIASRLASAQSSLPSAINLRFPRNFFLSSLLANVSVVSLISFDLLLAKHFLPPAQAGQYALLSLAGKMVFLIGALFSQFVNPVISRLQGAGNQRRQFSSFNLLLLATTFVCLATLAFVGPLGPLTLPLIFGPRILPILPFTTLYGLAMLQFQLATVFVTFHQVKGRYLFPALGVFASAGLIALVALNHSDIYSLVRMVSLVATSYLFALTLLHFTYHYLATWSRNLLDLVSVFAPLPDPALAPGKVNILIYNWRDLTHKWAGGAEEYLHQLARRWVAQGHGVTLFCGNDGHQPRYQEIDGVRIIRRGGFYTVYFWALIYHLFKFRRSFDVIIDSENGIPFFTPLYARQPIFLIIHHVHQQIFRQHLIAPLASLAQFLESRVMPFVYRHTPLVTVSPSSQRAIVNAGLAKTPPRIIYNGVDTQYFHPGEKSPHPLILYLGRLQHYKSLPVFIRAAQQVIQQIPQAQFAIAGFGEERAQLQQLIHDLKLSPWVKLLGRVTQEQKRLLYQRAWVFVNPSSIEGWGITTIEANACGTPVVASQVPGLIDSVQNPSTGFLVPYGNVSEFADKITLLLQNHQLRDRLSQNSRAWAQNFNWDTSADQFLSLVKSSLPQRSHLIYQRPVINFRLPSLQFQPVFQPINRLNPAKAFTHFLSFFI